MKRINTGASIAAALASLALAIAMPAIAQQGERISITTGGTGGVYYPLGGGMANILSKYVPGLSATAEVTGGSVDNLKLLNSGKSEVAFTMVDAAWDAKQGVDKFKDSKFEPRTLMVLYPNRMHVVTIDGTGINKLSDLKGKRVSTGSAGSGTEIMAMRILEAVGIDGHKDLKQERLGVAESVNAIKDRKIDAFFWVGGVPTAAVTDLATTPGVKLKLIDHAEAVDGMNKKYGPLYVKASIAQSSYSGHGQAEREHRRLEHPRRQRQDERQDGLRHREDALREEARARRGAQGGDEHRPQVPEDRLAAAVSPRCEEVFRGTRRKVLGVP